MWSISHPDLGRRDRVRVGHLPAWHRALDEEQTAAGWGPAARPRQVAQEPQEPAAVVQFRWADLEGRHPRGNHAVRGRRTLSGGDISAVGGFVVAGVIYWVLCILPVRDQALRESAEIASVRTGDSR